MTAVAAPPRLRLVPRARRALLTAHIVASVGLLGECAALLVVAVRAAGADDPASDYELMSLFSVIFGIPLSFAALLTGVALGLSSKWGVLRHGWVIAKLAAIVSVILLGALVLGPAEGALADGDRSRETLAILVPAYDVAVLCLATGLSVFKPRRR